MSSQESNDDLFEDLTNEVVLPAASLRDAPDKLVLNSIFDSPNIVPTLASNGKKVTQCLHCNGTYKIGHNATKIMYHVCKIKGKSITICPGNITPSWNAKYQDYILQKTHGQKGR